MVSHIDIAAQSLAQIPGNSNNGTKNLTVCVSLPSPPLRTGRKAET